ncbi:MAG: RNA polymerase sigma-70 factor [Vicingaceae bacterium]
MDRLLFQHIKNGDRKAFEQLFRTYYTALCRFACGYLKDMAQAEDTVQTVFVKLWEKRDSLAVESSLKAYLFQAVKNSCFNALKHEKVKAEHQSFQFHNAESKSEERTLETNEINELIHKKLDELPEKRKVIFLMSREEGLKYAEIAEKLNISVKTVETQMSLALKFLREQLKHVWLFLLFLAEWIKEIL